MLGASLPHFLCQREDSFCCGWPQEIGHDGTGGMWPESVRNPEGWKLITHKNLPIVCSPLCALCCPTVTMQGPSDGATYWCGNSHVQLLYVIHPQPFLLFLCVDLHKNSLKINMWAQHRLQWTCCHGWLTLPHTKEALCPTSTYPENHTNELRNF